MSQETRARLKAKRQRVKVKNTLIWGGLGAGVLVIMGVLIWSSVRPPVGEEYPIMESSGHVPIGADPGPFNTDPPTSGEHYNAPIEAGFYDEAAAAELGSYPEGYLVHNLEHGYIIFWYNCEILNEPDCATLKGQLQETLDDSRNIKVVAFPWSSLEVSVVATSWGRMLEFDSYNPSLALRFVRSNRNRAPEPQAP